ncbi:UNVERIFIED_CONTAM: hypothetical protein Scaly_2888500 [Sesamum calycinum]|uniref:Uncharacterized protein n=1 Tax=Sesamum calycinum TaxID=2727403 RepID=A0AAW2L9G7_9LAMI
MCKCRSHGTFPLFGLQSSHLNICYYHQDPHRRPLRPGSRPGFCSDRRALLLIGAWLLPRRPGIGRALQRHPFSGLVDSAVGHRNPASGSSRIASSAYQKWPTWSSRFPGAAQRSSRASFAPIPKSDERFARQYRCGPPPEFPLASPRSGIVHHLSGPDRRVEWEPAGQRRERAVAEARRRARAVRHDRGDGVPRAYRLPGLWPPPQSALVRAPSRSADRLSPFHIRPGRIACPHPLPSRQFQALFDSLFKVLFIFPSRYLFAIGLSPVFSLGRNLPPDWGCIPKQPDSPTAPRGAAGSGHDGALTLSGALSRGLGPGPPLRTLLQTTIRMAKPPDSQVGLFPVRSPLLGESLLDGSRDSAIHTKYRISLRSSSMREPRYPLPRVVLTFDRRPLRTGAPRTGAPRGGRFVWFSLARSAPGVRFDNDPSAGSPTETLLRLLLPLNDKVQWTSRDVAGSEPPTSPRSEHFTGPFNRQIAPPTKNGHAPPPIESRKSSQSVNPYYVWTWCRRSPKSNIADPWSASFMVETRTLFVFHKSKNFTSDYEIRMPPTVPVNHYSDPEGQPPEARPGQLRPGAHRRQKGRDDRCTPEADRPAQPKAKVRDSLSVKAKKATENTRDIIMVEHPSQL